MDDNEIKAALARYRKNIEISGKAMIVFAVWSIGKMLLPFLLGQQGLKETFGIIDPEAEKYMAAIIITDIVIFALILLFYTRLGGGAIRYAAGKSNQKGFFVRAVILMIITVAGLPLYFLLPDFAVVGETMGNTLVTALLLDGTTSLALGDMIYSTIRMEKIRKQYKTE